MAILVETCCPARRATGESQWTEIDPKRTNSVTDLCDMCSAGIAVQIGDENDQMLADSEDQRVQGTVVGERCKITRKKWRRSIDKIIIT